MYTKTTHHKLKLVLLSAVSLIVSIGTAELILRQLHSDTAYVAGPKYKKFQSYLRSHDELGFTWIPNISYSRDIRIEWADKDPNLSILSTDPDGFQNHPDAIRNRSANGPADIIGIGDSFMHDAAMTFFEFFNKHNMSYRNYAVPRYCPPQYNIALQRYGLEQKPSWVVYGLFINDFYESVDFERWMQSDEDWFTYHSGLWCGPPSPAEPAIRLLRAGFKGFYTNYRILNARFGNDIFTDTPLAISDNQVTSKIFDYVVEANTLCKMSDCEFLLVLIPSKDRILNQPATHEINLMTTITTFAEHANIRSLDLAKIFAGTDDPSSLYYETDGHWNRHGMLVGAEQILQYINSHPRDE